MCPMSSEPTPEELAKQQGVPARGASHYAKGTAANIVRSMAVIVAITLALFFMTGRQNTSTPQEVDVQEVAVDRGGQADEPFAYAEGLPDGWLATSARYARTDGDVMMWNAGYTTPDEEYVSVRQAVDGPRAWVGDQVRDGQRKGSFETEDGRTWDRYVSNADGQTQRSLVTDPKGKGRLTTIVLGTGDWDQVETLANHLVDAERPSKKESAPAAS